MYEHNNSSSRSPTRTVLPQNFIFASKLWCPAFANQLCLLECRDLDLVFDEVGGDFFSFATDAVAV